MRENERLVVIGTSLGGLAALRMLCSALPADFPAPIMVVMHVSSGISFLPGILSAACALEVRQASDGAPIETGTILLAPPDHHLLVEENRVRLSRGPKENHCRPAIDPLFRSAAIAHKAKVIGVILTGGLDDGVIGLQAIKAHGGVAIVQDPREAEAPSMPQSALDYVEVAYCLGLKDIAVKLDWLVRQPPAQAIDYDDNRQNQISAMENQFALRNTLHSSEENLDRLGTRSTQTCPECGGTLWEFADTVPTRFRCHTGHAFTTRSLLQVRSQLSEEALWSAVRALHEKHMLLKRTAAEARRRGADAAAREHEAAAKLAEQHADALRNAIKAE
jgi:two-component system chemotaxis response regulator CheB